MLKQRMAEVFRSRLEGAELEAALTYLEAEPWGCAWTFLQGMVAGVVEGFREAMAEAGRG
jgi:ribosomal protein L6P/L9E